MTRRCRAALQDEQGLSLVEILVAIVILGIVFGGFAAALINGARVSMQNERRVQETALSQTLHEELQAIPWEMAALYDNEITALPALRSDGAYPEGFEDLEDLDVSAGTFEGRELLTRDPWPEAGCDTDPTECGRLYFVPQAYEEEVESSGRTYEVVRLVTASPASIGGDDPHPVLRFTTLVRAELAGSTLVQRLDSERAATPAEIQAFDRQGVMQFLVFPQGLATDTDGTLVSGTDDLTIAVRFDRGVDPNSVEVTYDVLPDEATEPETRTIPLTEDFTVDGGSAPAGFWYRGKPPGYTSDAPALESGEWWTFSLTAQSMESPPVELEAEVDVYVAAEDVYDEDPPTMNNVGVDATVAGGLEVGIGPDGVDPATYCQDIGVFGTANAESSVLTYYTGVTSQSRPLTRVGSESSGRDRYRVTFTEGAPSQWLPTTATSFTERFLLVAVSAEGRTSRLHRTSPDEVTFVRAGGGGAC